MQLLYVFSDIRGDKKEEMKGTLHYMFDGVMPFLQVQTQLLKKMDKMIQNHIHWHTIDTDPCNWLSLFWNSRFSVVHFTNLTRLRFRKSQSKWINLRIHSRYYVYPWDGKNLSLKGIHGYQCLCLSLLIFS